MSVLLNRLAPDFSLPAVAGGRFALADWRGFVVVVNFWSSECPWSRRADVLLVYRQLTWYPKGVRIVGIVSNVNEAPPQILYEAENRRVKYPILLDNELRTADAFKAETTPHIFVVDRQGLVRYAGGVDDATQKQREARNFHLDRAVAALLDNRLPEPALTPPFGCPIVRQVHVDTGPISSLPGAGDRNRLTSG